MSSYTNAPEKAQCERVETILNPKIATCLCGGGVKQSNERLYRHEVFVGTMPGGEKCGTRKKTSKEELATLSCCRPPSVPIHREVKGKLFVGLSALWTTAARKGGDKGALEGTETFMNIYCTRGKQRGAGDTTRDRQCKTNGKGKRKGVGGGGAQ